MALSIISTRNIAGLGASVKAMKSVYTPDQSADLDITIAPGSVDFLVPFVFPKATLQIMAMVPSGGDLTVKTNSSSTPQETLVLRKDVGIYWANDEGSPCPIAGPITAIYVSNATAVPVKLIAGAGYGQTL